jgi:hypothetical protein
VGLVQPVLRQPNTVGEPQRLELVHQQRLVAFERGCYVRGIDRAEKVGVIDRELSFLHSRRRMRHAPQLPRPP